MKRFLLVAVFAIGALVGGNFAVTNHAGYFGSAPAPAATPTLAPTTGPTLVPSSTSTDVGLPFGYPNTMFMGFDLNATNATVAVVNLTGTNACTVSVYGTFTADIVVTAAKTKANLQSLSYVVGVIAAPGQYYYNLAGNTMIQFNDATYTAGDPIVDPNCPGGTVVMGGQALLKSQ